jgi:hypothetical protein
LLHPVTAQSRTHASAPAKFTAFIEAIRCP